jgi:broad specificity phosphatase PhoE
MILPALTTVYLARHGQSDWNNQKRVSGQGNPGLSPRGAQQSRALAECLSGEKLSAIYTSRLNRTMETARPTALAQGLPIQSLDGLNEIHMGILQGRYRDERDPEASQWWSEWQRNEEGFRIPGGETFAEMKHRALASLKQIVPEHAGASVLIVGHRGTNRVLLAALMEWPAQRSPDLRLRSRYFYRIRAGTPPRITTVCLTGSKKGCEIEDFVM